jgi:GBP family porin
MKITGLRRAGLLAAIVTAMVGGAHAQSSVVLYGIVDAGVLYKTGAGPRGAGGPSTGVVSSIESTDRWGLRGVEDLGGGIAATFNLENGFRLNNGQGIGMTSTSSVFFDRGATVGLKSTLGWIQLGRNWSPFHDELALNDTSGFINFGSLNTISYQTGSGYTGAQYYWADNSVRYTSPRIAGFQGSALYGFGGTPAGDITSKSDPLRHHPRLVWPALKLLHVALWNCLGVPHPALSIERAADPVRWTTQPRLSG